MSIRLSLNSFLFSLSFPVIYSKRQAGFPLRLNAAKNLFYDFFFTCFKNQLLSAAFLYFLPLSFSLLQTAPSPFSVTFLMLHPLTYKRTLFPRQYVVCTKISSKKGSSNSELPVTYLYGLNVLLLIKTYFFTYISSIPKLFKYS